MNLPQISMSTAREDLRTEPRIIRVVIIAIAVTFLTVFVVLPASVPVVMIPVCGFRTQVPFSSHWMSE